LHELEEADTCIMDRAAVYDPSVLELAWKSHKPEASHSPFHPPKPRFSEELSFGALETRSKGSVTLRAAPALLSLQKKDSCQLTFSAEQHLSINPGRQGGR
jgi:hypothetical protein